MIEKCVYSFSAQNEPITNVKTGEEIIFRTMDCFSNEIRSNDQLTTNFSNDHTNPATGPVYVEGAEPGDVLVVDILNIEVDDMGVITTLPGCGPLNEFVEIRTCTVPIKNNRATFKDMEFPINPMIGVIGVAPAEGSVSDGYPGTHGGNMDNHLIVAGTRLYLPIQVSGALFQLGDLHATMGDGEICGTGIEIPGKVTVKFSVIKNLPMKWPVHETKDRWYTIACDHDYPTALKNACRAMQELIMKAYSWDATDAFLYMSVQGDTEICQGCKPCGVELIIRFGIPKRADKPLIKA